MIWLVPFLSDDVDDPDTDDETWRPQSVWDQKPPPVRRRLHFPGLLSLLITGNVYGCPNPSLLLQCYGSGSGIRCLFDPGIRNRFFPDPGSRIPNPYFLELSDNFWGKKFYNSLKIGLNFFLQHFKTKIMLNFLNLWLYKKVPYDNKFFSPLSFTAVVGSEIRDPGC